MLNPKAEPDPLYFLSARQRAEYGPFVRDVFRDFDASDPRRAGRELLVAAFPSGKVNEYTLKRYLRRWSESGWSNDHMLAAMAIVAATPEVRRPFRYVEKIMGEWKRPRAEPSGRSHTSSATPSSQHPAQQTADEETKGNPRKQELGGTHEHSQQKASTDFNGRGRAGSPEDVGPETDGANTGDDLYDNLIER